MNNLKELRKLLKSAKETGVTPVMKVGRVARPHFSLRKSPMGDKDRNLHLNDFVFVDRAKARPGDNLSWLHVYATPKDDSQHTVYEGWMRSDGIFLDPPDSQARVHYVEKDEKLINIAAKYYKPKKGFKWGDDARFYVTALGFVNRNYAGMNLPKGWTDNKFKRIDAFKSMHIKSGHALWIPSKTIIQAYKGIYVSSGSFSYELWQVIKKIGSELWDFAVSLVGFVAGLVHGALKSVYDLFVGIVDLVEAIWKAFRSLLTGNFIEDAKALWKAVKEIDVRDMIKDFGDKWTNPDPWERGYFQGKVTGYVIAEIVMAVFSVGWLTAAKWVGKSSKFAKIATKLMNNPVVKKIATRAPKKVKPPSGPGHEMIAKFTGVSSKAAKAARAVLQKKISDIPILKKHWDDAGKAARTLPDYSTYEAATKTYNRHRDRFWKRVKKDPKARQVFEDAGFVWRGTEPAPVYPGLEGRFGKVSLEHTKTRKSHPKLATDPSNLEFVIMGDNTILDTLKRAFKKHAPDWPDSKIKLDDLKPQP